MHCLVTSRRLRRLGFARCTRTRPSVISNCMSARKILTLQMTTLPQTIPSIRPTRVRFAETTPAVLRFQDGRRTTGQLQIVSITGGLLSVPRPLDKGSHVKLMFLTDSGPVLGAAEMLSPLSWGQQPFRFLALGEGDRRILGSAIQSSLRQYSTEAQWIEKYRTALASSAPPPRPVFRVILGALTFGLLCLGSMFYLLHIHRLR
jgi:hypothetical protein